MSTVDEELAKEFQKMDEAEAKLTEIGFPEEHWLQIRKYVDGAIGSMQLRIAKKWEEYLDQPPEPDS